MTKRNYFFLAAALVISFTSAGCGSSREDNSGRYPNGQVIVYNWGEYIGEDVIAKFEEETGIQVIYDMFETNEEMYPKVESGAVAYDVICPSDYMIQKMRENGLLQPIDFSNVPNLKYIGSEYLEYSRAFDPENSYSVPYCWGTVGILYNKTMVEEPVDSWDILWDLKYKNEILMQKSVRDAFAVAEKKLDFSLNSTSEPELAAARDLLIEQKPLVQAYVIDQVRDMMIGNEAAIGVIYSGEALYTQEENENLEYVIPKEGSNLWFDSWVIPANAPNKKNAEAWINFMCRPDIAYDNFDYITYGTPNTGAMEMMDEELLENPVLFPDEELLEECEVFQYLGPDAEAIYDEYWMEVLSE